MAFRNKKMTMPSIDDIIMQIMAMSEAFYDGQWSIGWSVWDIHRPAAWPTAKYLLKFYGYSDNSAGWDELIARNIGTQCKSFLEVMQEEGEKRAAQRWHLSDKPDYSASYNEQHEALAGGLPICKATYERTGRMMLR